MDTDLEDLHNSLLQVQLPSTINDLKTPTEEYVVKVLKKFLTIFSIDANLISKPTLEQQSVIPYSEDCNLIGLINLHAAMAEICNQTYTPQFSITDITTPGQKRTRRFLKFLTNFIFYTSNKELEIQDRVDEIHNRARQLEEMILKQNEIRSEINDKALHNAKQMSEKEKLEQKIKDTRTRIKANNKRLFELSNIVTGVKEKKEEALEVCESYKSRASKLNKEVAELQSEIVTSPEECKSRLETLEQIYKAKLEERETMQEAFQEKKQLIQQQENTLNFVKKQLDELSDISDLYKQLKSVITKEGNIKQQLEALKSSNIEWENEVAVQQDQYKGIKIYDVQSQCKERLSPLRNLHKQLFSEKKLMEVKLEEDKVKYNELYLQKNDMENQINKFEQEISDFQKNCQDLYDSEVSAEADVWKDVSGL